LLDQRRRPTSHNHSLFQIGSFTFFFKLKDLGRSPFFEPLPDVNSVTKRKKRRSWFSQNPAVVSVCLPKHPTMAPKAVKTLFLLSWSENTSILLQTLAENRVSAFLYLLLLPELEVWIGELFIESQTCNNITMPIE